MPTQTTGKYFEISYQGPYAGLNVQTPEILLDPHSSPNTRNFMFRNAELRSRPSLVSSLPAPPNNTPLGLASFMDAENTIHSVCFTPQGLWSLEQAGNSVWNFLGGSQLSVNNPVSVDRFISTLYYTNGNPYLSSWDGMASSPTNSVATVANLQTVLGSAYTTSPGDIGAKYIGELSAHLIMANLSVLDTGSGSVYSLPNYIWWSASGLPAVWDPSVNTSAGYNPLVDVPDQITGLVTLGMGGYIFRTNGITQFYPTGSGIAPFQFDHLWASARGIGNAFAWSVSSYGSMCCFISTEQVYQMSINSWAEIGGGARDALMADLANATGTPVAQLTPAYAWGYIYLTYVVSIPLGQFTRNYVYSLEDKNWSVWDVSGLLVSGKPNLVWNTLRFYQTLYTYAGGTANENSINQQGFGGNNIPGGSGFSKPPLPIMM